MNQFPEVGSTFKGRVLMSVELMDTDETAFLVKELEQIDLDK